MQSLDFALVRGFGIAEGVDFEMQARFTTR
jgi:hypothetical protein